MMINQYKLETNLVEKYLTVILQDSVGENKFNSIVNSIICLLFMFKLV